MTIKNNKMKHLQLEIAEFCNTRNIAFFSSSILRSTERNQAARFFFEHSNVSFTRNELSQELGKPINHITRIVDDLIKSGVIAVTEIRKSRVSGKLNEALKYLEDK